MRGNRLAQRIVQRQYRDTASHLIFDCGDLADKLLTTEIQVTLPFLNDGIPDQPIDFRAGQKLNDRNSRYQYRCQF